MSSSLTHEQLLHKFLKHHRAYSKFIRNRNEYQPHYSGRVTRMYNLIADCGFDWDSSPEGAAYWKTLHTKWGELTVHFGIAMTFYPIP